jgi:VTC domain
MKRRFNRFELKYIIPGAVRDLLLPTIREHMTVDSYAVDGTYLISSMYYDSPQFDCYRSKIDGIKYRRKVRIRSYGEFPSSPAVKVMLEIKQRINRTTQKRRIALPLAQAHALCTGQFDLEFSDPLDAAVGGEITFLSRSLLLAPACLVVYQRQAFEGNVYDPGLRVTFDALLRCAPADAVFDPSRPRHAFLPDDWFILEVKADEVVPLWVARLLATHGVTLNRFSKYCAAVTRLSELGLLTTLGERHDG